MDQVRQAGQIIIIALIFMVVILVLVGALLGFVFQNVGGTRRAVAGEQALQLADAGIDKAVWRLNQTAGAFSGETDTVLGTGVFDVSVATLSGNLKEVTATGYVPNKTNPQARKQVKVQVSIDTTTISFNYGILVGEGGLQLQNSARVVGNVYSNGLIDGTGGTARITGDVYSAGPSGRIFNRVQIDGSAHAHRIDTNVTIGGSAYGQIMDRVTVGGNVFTNSLSRCTIGGNAFFTTKTACTIAGSQTTPYSGEPDPPPETFPPIPSSQIESWKAQAASGGTITGNYLLSGTQQASLGPKKIVGDLRLSNTARLTLTGPLWVTGEIEITNSAVVALAASYGNNSEVMIADGIIEVKNSAVFQKAGPNSYIMLLTTATGNDDQFEIGNSADGLIAYAPNGEVEITNSAGLREIVGWRVEVKNSAQVTYESGLANVNFSSGPGGSWTVVRGTWREIK